MPLPQWSRIAGTVRALALKGALSIGYFAFTVRSAYQKALIEGSNVHKLQSAIVIDNISIVDTIVSSSYLPFKRRAIRWLFFLKLHMKAEYWIIHFEIFSVTINQR